MRRGICTAGNLIVDHSYPISAWPGRGELVTILEGKESTTGGLACNVPMALAQLDSGLPQWVAGNLGDDAEGHFILSQFAAYPSLNTQAVRRDGQTSFTLVMNDSQSKERTFFQYRGSNAAFDGSGIPWDVIQARIFHAGYILLMDALDSEDAQYGTVMARLLARARQQGMETSVDVVSETGERFTRLVPPALRWADYCIINEYEAQQVTGIPLRSDGQLLANNMPLALEKLKQMGVRRWAVVHSPQGGWGLDEKGVLAMLPSLRLPEGFIRSTTGAGDNFCAGVLYGAHENMALLDALRLGIATAAISLQARNTFDGIAPLAQTMDFYRRLGGV